MTHFTVIGGPMSLMWTCGWAVESSAVLPAAAPLPRPGQARVWLSGPTPLVSVACFSPLLQCREQWSILVPRPRS